MTPFAISALVGVVAAVAVISPRFKLALPGQTDDWSQLRFAPRAWHQLMHLTYDPTTFDAQRYRPAFWGIWSELQWHTFGAPATLSGPNAWNLARVVLFAAAAGALAVACLRLSGARGSVHLGFIAGIPALLVCATPREAVDLARFGPQEPLFFGSLAFGVLLLGRFFWRLADPDHDLSAADAVIAAIGLSLWTFGVFTKEAALALAVLIPFAVVVWRKSNWRDGRRRLIALGVITLAAIPWLFLASRVAQLYTGPHELVYGAERPHGLFGWATHLGDIMRVQLAGLRTFLGSTFWWVMFAAIPLVAIGFSLWRRGPAALLALALSLVAWSILVFQGLTGVVESRYYIPSATLIAIAAIVLLATLPRAAQLGGVGLAAIAIALDAPDARLDVTNWASAEQQSEQFVRAVADLDPQSCRVYYSGLNLERRYSVPVLVSLIQRPGGTCSSQWRAVVVRAYYSPADAADQQVRSACAAPGWQHLEEIPQASVFGCRRFKPNQRRILASRRLRIPPHAAVG